MADEVKARRLLVKGREMTAVAVEAATRLHSVWRAVAAMSLWSGGREVDEMVMMVVGCGGWDQGVVANKGMIQCTEDNTTSLVLSSSSPQNLQSVVVDRTPPERRKTSSPCST